MQMFQNKGRVELCIDFTVKVCKLAKNTQCLPIYYKIMYGEILRNNTFSARLLVRQKIVTVYFVG